MSSLDQLPVNASAPFEGKLENGCTPIKLKNFETIGFAKSNAKRGDEVVVQTAGLVTSDTPEFYLYANGFTAVIQNALREAGVFQPLAVGGEFALVVHRDKSATFYPEGFAQAMRARPKKDMKALEMIYQTDVSDIERLSLPAIPLSKEDRVVLVLRFGWKFVLFYNLTPESEFSIDEMERVLGASARRMLFEEVYQAVESQAEAQPLIDAGWFPFNEIIGGEFETIARAYRYNFSIEDAETALAGAFTPERLSVVTDQWWHCREFNDRRSLLAEGVANFVDARWPSAIKVLITEIEGILRDRYRGVIPDTVGIQTVLGHATSEAEARAGAPDSLYFSTAFLAYLKVSFFGKFDAVAGVTTASRHSVGHGAAPSSLYTQKRALQTILVLDQLSRYMLAR